MYKNNPFHSHNVCGIITIMWTLIQITQSYPCGQSQWWRLQNINNRRITGGNEAQPGQFPWQVYLWTPTKGYCGGAILDKRWILTAEHCVNGMVATRDILIYTEQTERPADNSDNRNISVDRVILHAFYNISEYIPNDIALLRLTQDLPFENNPNLEPICYPQANYNLSALSNLDCYVSGFGTDRFNHPRQKLHYARAQLSIQCTRGKSLCAWHHGNVNSACKGDSGSPVACLIDGIWTAVGIHSHGQFTVKGAVEQCNGANCCKNTAAAVYTSLTHYSDWISLGIKTLTLTTMTTTSTTTTITSFTTKLAPNINDTPCGSSAYYSVWHRHNRQGENPANIFQFPWLAIVKVKDRFCMGVLIHARFVLTVASCMEGIIESVLRVHLGRVSRPGYHDNTGIRVRRIIFHGHNDFNLSGVDNVALLELSNELTLTANYNVQAACYLKSHGNIREILKQDCYVTGFGYDDSHDYRQRIYYRDSNSSPCYLYRLCEFYTNRTRPCVHDSGSPLVCLVSNTWTVMGLYYYSFGYERPLPCSHRECCDIRKADFYASVTDYSKWIEAQING